ncbi:alpha/beta hydrolase-fold protein [Pedobacter aquatilis]|uniref:alpha/beta hydrolase-fold protein n=1 Tax=Pedobacter aquatilis TaxID=351343 RepID=UPI00292CB367|nr:alpha/beta hydrolase-fold protein [Pedobacter aquatilis]
MKKIFLISCFVFIAFFAATGQVVSHTDKLYAPKLRDTITYTVYFPQDWEGWDQRELHPVIYAVNYGMLNGDYLAAQVAYFRKARYAMPNSLIVVINASMERMGYQYQTGALSDEGKRFVSFMKEELIPEIAHHYHTSDFRTYIGHSFAASFGSYLFLNEPGMFNGFILLAPEKIGAEQPPFHLSAQAKNYYDEHHTFFYSAVGYNDLQRRKDFAMEMGRETSRIDSGHFYFQYDSIARADHTNILTLSIEFALKHIYKFFTPYSGKDELDALADLKQVATTIKNAYGLEMEKNFTFYSPFANEAIDNKDTTALKAILSYFEGPQLKGWNLMQFGEFSLRLKLKDLAARYFTQAIAKINSQELGIANGPPNLMVCYRHMAFDIYADQPEHAWNFLIQALQLAQSGNRYLPDNGVALIELGKYASQAGHRMKEGLKYLSEYRAGKFAQNDMAAVYMAGIYQKLNQPKQARKYIAIALRENPDNQQAKAWDKMIRSR